MVYLRKKLIRELWSMKLRGSLIILSIGLTIGLYGGLLLVEDSILASRDLTLNELSYEDAGFRTFGFANQENISKALKSVDNIKTLDQRLTISTIVNLEEKDYSGSIHGINASNRPKINNFKITSGTYFTKKAGNEVIMESHFASNNKLSIGDNLSIRYGNSSIVRKIVGMAFSPEYKYVVNPNSGLPESGVYSPMWMPIDEVRKLVGKTEIINEIFIQVTDKTLLDQTISHVTSALVNIGIDTRVTRGDKELDYLFMEEDISALGDFAVTIGLVILIVAVFIIYDSMTKIIISQKTIIGILRALGGKKQSIVLHYLGYGMMLSIIGTIIGIPVGYFLSYIFTDNFATHMGMPFITTKFSIMVFITPIHLTLSIAFLTSLIISYKVTSIRPVDAITNQTITLDFSKKYSSEKFFEILSKKKKYTNKIPIRHVLRRKKRSILTGLTISVATILVITSLGFMDSFFEQIDKYYCDNYQYDLEAYFSEPQILGNIEDQLKKIDGLGSYEEMVRQPAFIMGTSNNFSTNLNAYNENSRLRTFTFQEGSLKEGEVALGRVIADELDVNNGDSVWIATEGYGDELYIFKNYKISGIIAEFFDIEIFMTLSTAQSDLHLGNKFTSLAINVSGNIDTVKKDLLASSLPLSGLKDAKQAKNSFITMLEGTMGFVFVLVIVGILTLILFSLNVIVLDVIEREREFINLRTNGAQIWTIGRIISIQILLIAFFVVFLNYFLTPVVISYLIDETFGSVVTVNTYVQTISYVIGTISLLIGLSVGILSSLNQTMKIDLSSALRIRFRN